MLEQNYQLNSLKLDIKTTDERLSVDHELYGKVFSGEIFDHYSQIVTTKKNDPMNPF